MEGYDHIAPIEMYAILRALKLFESSLRRKAIFMFVDNTHAIGCLLKGGAALRESPDEYVKIGPRRPSHQALFERLPASLQNDMNRLAREIWCAITRLDLIVWIQYVWTKVNLADAPSRGMQPSVGRCVRVGHGARKRSFEHDESATFQ